MKATPSARPPRNELDLKLAQAYTTLICNFPFFASVLMHLKRREDPTCQTMWTDGKHLGFNADFVMKLSRDELVGVLCHEVLHVAALHPFRRGGRQPKAWNIACDKVVNHIVQEAKLVLPKNCIPAVAGKSAEELYSDLPPDPSGGGAGAPNNDPGGTGEVRDPTNAAGQALTDAGAEEAMNEARIVVSQALNAAKRAGKLPAGLQRMVEDALEPRVPWREILSRFVDSHAKSDYSWMQPNRRYVGTGFMFPSLHSLAYGTVTLGCDTSGSIDQVQLKEIASELLGCLDVYTEQGQTPELTVAWFDHAVYPQIITDGEELRPQGGGGTSFRVVMEWLATEPVGPKALIMVTDGECGDFGEAPEIPVLWILTHQNRSFDPPFGEVTCVINE